MITWHRTPNKGMLWKGRPAVAMMDGRVYSVNDLIAIAEKSLPVRRFGPEELAKAVREAINLPVWSMFGRLTAPLEFIKPGMSNAADPGVKEHADRILACDHTQPVLYDPRGNLMDGYHRMAKIALMSAQEGVGYAGIDKAASYRFDTFRRMEPALISSIRKGSNEDYRFLLAQTIKRIRAAGS